MKIQFNKLPSNPNDNTLVFFIPENDKKNNKGQIQGLDQDTLDRISNASCHRAHPPSFHLISITNPSVF